MTRKYYKGLYLISILADREIPAASGPEGMIGILGQAVDGDFVGSLEMHDVSELTPAAMEQELWRAGSEAGFFDLPDTLSEAEDLFDSVDADENDHELVKVSRATFNQFMEAMGSSKRFDL